MSWNAGRGGRSELPHSGADTALQQSPRHSDTLYDDWTHSQSPWSLLFMHVSTAGSRFIHIFTKLFRLSPLHMVSSL